MSAGDEAIYERVLKIENKDVFVDLKSNQNGVYLKISERNGSNRSSVLIPSSGIHRLGEVLQEIIHSKEFKDATRASGDKGISPLRAERDANSEVKQRSVYVSNLSWETEESELMEHMKQAGHVLSTVILRRNTRSLGCGIVEYATREMAWNAVKLMNDSDLDGRSIHVREDKVAESVGDGSAAAKIANRPRRQADIPPEEKVVEPTKVFVSNLTWTTSEEELVACFCSVGDVVGVEIRQTRGGRSLGCGVVEFSTPSYARACIDSMNGQDLNGRKMSIREYYQ
jgi:RNA recognition motif-containing protein